MAYNYESAMFQEASFSDPPQYSVQTVNGDSFHHSIIHNGNSKTIFASQLKQLMDGYKYSVVVGFNVENATKFQLSDPVVRIKGGAVEAPFCPIGPGTNGMFVTRKTSGTATGMYGTVSWQIQPDFEKPRHVVVMWSAPFDFNLHDNYLGVGISDPSYGSTARDWFDTMYYSNRRQDEADGFKEGLRFNRNKFHRHCKSVRVSSGGISVEGTMGSGHKPQVHVVINEMDMA